MESDQNIINLAFDQIRHDHRLLPHSNFKFISRTLTSVDPFEAVKLGKLLLLLFGGSLSFVHNSIDDNSYLQPNIPILSDVYITSINDDVQMDIIHMN